MTGQLKLPDQRNFKWLTVITVTALVIGFALGLIANSNLTPAFETLYLILKPVEQGWMLAIRVVVIPLMFLYVIVAVAGRSRDGGTTSAIKFAATIHLILLSATLLVVIIAVPFLLNLFEITPEIADAFRATADIASESYPFVIPPDILNVWELVFDQPVLDAVYAQILPIIAVSFLLSFALLRSPDKIRIPIVNAFTNAANVCMTLVSWILYFMPAGVLALSYTVAVSKGVSLLLAVLFFIVLVSGLLIGATLMLYPITAIYAKIPMSLFARAVAPAQSVAFGTRSSLMCLTSLSSGAEEVLQIPKRITSVIMPISVSTFKLNRMVSTPTKLFFFAHLYSIELAVASSAVLLGIAFIKSFGTAGIPSGGSMTTLPLYLAAGIPLEGILILKAVDVIPDIFKTILNVTEDLAVTTMATHASGIKLGQTTSRRVFQVAADHGSESSGVSVPQSRTNSSILP